ncbi:MAG TPA: ATP-binding protein [Holophagaceae bacterium]|nr:ATP-binding protein [Holophagaceae bacterium]
MTGPSPTPFTTRLSQEGRKVFNTRTAPLLRVCAYLFMSAMLPLYNHAYEGRWALKETFCFAAVTMLYSLGSWLSLRRWYGRTGALDLQEPFLVLDLILGVAFMLMTGAADTPMYPFLWFIVAANASTTYARAMRYVHLGIVSYLLMVFLSPRVGHPVTWGRVGISLAFLYFGGILLAMPTLMVDALRKRNREAYGAIARLNEHLEAQAESLREARAAAERANQAKSTFLASMSHELRTPLNAVLGFTQLMIRGQRLSPEDQEHAGRILRSGEHLLGLINDVLSIAKIEAGRLVLNPTVFNLRDLGRDLELMLRDRAQAKGLALQVDLDPGAPEAVVGDEGKLRQILLNLLGNAVKFTGRGSVRLRIDYRDGWAGFTVQDTGPGMNAQELTHLFQPFYQAEAGVRASEGTGLGLHISKAMVEAMGGALDVASAPGEGTTLRFRVPLPLREDAAAYPEARAGAPGGLAPGQELPRLLVVDDQEDNRVLLDRLFSGLGFQVRTAGDGVEAVALWESFRPRAVVMDIKMPRMDGLEAARLIRGHEGERPGPPTILLALTASVFEEEREALRDFDAFVGKPFKAEGLVATLAGLLGLALLPPTPAEARPDEATQDFQALPGAWKAAFLEALRSGDLEEAEARLRELGDPKVAEPLRASLRAYRFDELRRRLG